MQTHKMMTGETIQSGRTSEKPKRAPRARGNPEGSPWRNGPEASRHSVQVKLRLRREAAAELRAVAARDHGGDMSATVAALAHEALERPNPPER